MIPWVHLDTAAVPDGGGELRLMQRGAEFSIMSGAIELMSSRVSGSEKALATLSKMDKETGLFYRDITAIDMRLPDRLTVRLSENAAKARDE